jgi:hypothetical protein
MMAQQQLTLSLAGLSLYLEKLIYAAFSFKSDEKRGIAALS